jgi:hypothetical protein
VFLLFLILLLGADDQTGELARKMRPVFEKDAAEYALAVESAPKKELELKKEPVFEWTNPVRTGGVQQGIIFLWLRDGRPAAIGDFFSEPEGKTGGRRVIHEFHALDVEKLIVTRPKGALNEWKPEVGLARKELTDAPEPATTPAARLLQMKKLAQEFTGHETNPMGKRWDLRLLPAPIYRYPTAKTGVIDGTLFVMVSTEGTDPEVLILIEARETEGKIRWEYACGRYSDRSLYVQRKDKEVWSMVRSDSNTFLHDPQHLFRVYADKVVDLDGKLLARVKATEKVWWGELLPVEDKK